VRLRCPTCDRFGEVRAEDSLGQQFLSCGHYADRPSPVITTKEPPDLLDMFRKTDPETSKLAARDVDRNGQQAQVIAYLRTHKVGIPDDLPGTWRRWPELHRAGVIRLTGTTRTGSSGKLQREYEYVTSDIMVIP